LSYGTQGARVGRVRSDRMSWGDSLGLTEAAQSRLAHALDSAESIRQRLNDDGYPIEHGSELAGDDAKWPAYALSHTLHHSLGAATDHIHALRSLIFDAGVLHLGAPYTLLRAVIENSSVALWLLAPTSRTTRLSRLVGEVWRDRLAGDDVVEELRGSRDKTGHDAFRAKLEALIRDLDLAPDSLADVRTSRIVREAEVTTSVPHLLAQWKICAGFSHGKRWAYLAMSDLAEVSRDGDVPTIRIEAGSEQFAMLVNTSYLTLRAAADLFDQRGRNHLRGIA
jgi:hypothetical protein